MKRMMDHLQAYASLATSGNKHTRRLSQSGWQLFRFVVTERKYLLKGVLNDTTEFSYIRNWQWLTLASRAELVAVELKEKWTIDIWPIIWTTLTRVEGVGFPRAGRHRDRAVKALGLDGFSSSSKQQLQFFWYRSYSARQLHSLMQTRMKWFTLGGIFSNEGLYGFTIE